ncbi:MAG: hypothetical protein H7320_23085 [Ferruginibacter sp.]|nr:hypothetical protein [Ferruginibacter sp.]
MIFANNVLRYGTPVQMSGVSMMMIIVKNGKMPAEVALKNVKNEIIISIAIKKENDNKADRTGIKTKGLTCIG